MHDPMRQTYRLIERGGAGLACDGDGVALGAAELVRLDPEAAGPQRYRVQSRDRIEQILQTAYGVRSSAAATRLHQGLHRVAAWLDAGDLGRAGVQAVMLGLPDLSAAGAAKLAAAADVAKGGDAYLREPRLPKGQTGGGQWTTGGASSTETAPGDKQSRPVSLPLDDGVYRPGIDDPIFTPVGGAEEDEPRPGSNGPPEDFTSLLDVFPGFRASPWLAVPMAPVDSFLALSGPGDAANFAGTLATYRYLIGTYIRM